MDAKSEKKNSKIIEEKKLKLKIVEKGHKIKLVKLFEFVLVITQVKSEQSFFIDCPSPLLEKVTEPL